MVLEFRAVIRILIFPKRSSESKSISLSLSFNFIDALSLITSIVGVHNSVAKSNHMLLLAIRAQSTTKAIAPIKYSHPIKQKLDRYIESSTIVLCKYSSEKIRLSAAPACNTFLTINCFICTLTLRHVRLFTLARRKAFATPHIRHNASSAAE